MRMPGGNAAKSNASASAQWTVSFSLENRFSSRAARSRSTSTTCSLSTLSRRGAVNAPSPGPISTMESFFLGLISFTKRSTTWRSWRKCCPNLLRGGCKFDRKLHCLDEAAWIGFSAAGDIERRAVIDRGAHEGQAQRDIHAAPEARVLEDRQSLVVVHGEHAIGAFQPLGHEERVGGKPAARLGPQRNCFLNCWSDDLGVFCVKMPGFAAVGVNARDPDARVLYLVTPLQVSVQPAPATHTTCSC